MTGILLIDKEPDWTSHDVIAKLRGVLKERRMGHAGTLDPMATGLLVVLCRFWGPHAFSPGCALVGVSGCLVLLA